MSHFNMIGSKLKLTSIFIYFSFINCNSSCMICMVFFCCSYSIKHSFLLDIVFCQRLHVWCNCWCHFLPIPLRFLRLLKVELIFIYIVVPLKLRIRKGCVCVWVRCLLFVVFDDWRSSLQWLPFQVHFHNILCRQVTIIYINFIIFTFDWPLLSHCSCCIYCSIPKFSHCKMLWL